MILVEKHIIKNTHPFYNECDELCFLSKNLYNQGLYNIRQHYFDSKKYLTYESNYHVTKTQDSYRQLPAKVSCQTLRLVDQNFKSFFNLIKMNDSRKVRIPQYLHKTKGRYIVKYPKQALSKRTFDKKGHLKLSKSNLIIKTQVTDWNSIKEVRIIPRVISKQYVIEVVYEKQEKINNGNIIASIDPGLNNLSTVTFNKEYNPIIINGRPLKSINQYYNKKRARLQGELEVKQKRKTSNRLTKLTNKRNNKVSDYLHKASRVLVNQLVSHNVKTLIIGKNVNQKQDINIGKKNNQNFVNVPLFRYLDMIKYKAMLEGIEVIFQEESYTSKSSFLSLDDIPVYGEPHNVKFSGYRSSRGLYKDKSLNRYINADVNGSYNIMRKAIPNVFTDGIEGIGVCPVKLNV